MKGMEYQTPKFLIQVLDGEDVLTASGETGENPAESFDKGVEDFFGE